MVKILLSLILVLSFIPLVLAADGLIIADFDSGVKPANNGGDFGSWDKDPQDFTQTCFESFCSTIKHGDIGFSLKIDYDVDSPNPAYNGFWLKLMGEDFSKYNNFKFWIKGDTNKGYTKVLKIELKNDKGEVGKYYVTGITEQWQEIVVPFNKMAGITDFSSMEEFVIVFEDRIATDKEGSIYIDDISVTK